MKNGYLFKHLQFVYSYLILTMDYTQYTFTVTPPEPGSDILIAMLGDIGFESFVQNNTGFEAYILSENLNEALINDLDFSDFTYTFTKTIIPKTNWNDEWEKNFTPVYVEDLACIRAHFHPIPTNVLHDIIITPKMSFGTGHHDTTWLMSKSMFNLQIEQSSVLDMGCGTGILAILAKKMNAKNVLGIDIDDWSIENSIENAEVNLTKEIKFEKGDASLLPLTETFDIILANINKNVLKNDLSKYYNCLKKEGFLLLSGFFTTDVEELKQLATKIGFNFVEKFNKNEWAVIKLQKH